MCKFFRHCSGLQTFIVFVFIIGFQVAGHDENFAAPEHAASSAAKPKPRSGEREAGADRPGLRG